MKKRIIVLGLRDFNYTTLCIFAQKIHDGLQLLAALFPSPVIPLSVFHASINNMIIKIEEWGPDGSIGGKPELLALQIARNELREMLISYANYVRITQPDNPQSWLEVGFVLKKLPTRTNSMEAVQNLHQFIARNISPGDIKLKWMRPLAAPKAMLITYKVLRSADEHFANAVLIGTTVNKATFMDTPGKAGIFFFYWVIPVTTAGDGVRSEVCRAFASPV